MRLDSYALNKGAVRCRLNCPIILLQKDFRCSVLKRERLKGSGVENRIHEYRMSFDKNASVNRPTVIRSQIYSAVIGYKPINNSAKVNRIGYREHELDNTSEFQCFDVLLDIFRRLSTRFVAQHSHVMRSYFSSLARQAAPITQFLAAVDTEDGRMDELLVRRTDFARLRPCLRMLAVN